MKTSKKGYLRNSPDVNKPQNIIEGGDITMKGVDFNVLGVDSNGYAKVMTPGNNYKFPNAEYVIETPIKNKTMNKELKYMPIDDKAGTFMSKHCSPVSYGSPNKQIDPKAIGGKIEQVKRYRDYVGKKEKGYIDPEDGFIKGDPSKTVSFDRFVISEEIGKGGKAGGKAVKHYYANKDKYSGFLDEDKRQAVKKGLNIK
jgi:hypothetical protein